MVSAKNMMLSGAATDLGLGDQLREQLDDIELQRKKKLLMQAKGIQANPMGNAAQVLFSGVGTGGFGA